MFRSQYDSDITLWSPQGRLHQIEYATEAVKQGTAAVGLCSNNHVVLVALKKSHGQLASSQRKLFPIDEHVGIAIAGLTSDARVLSTFMRAKALASKVNVERNIPLTRLMHDLACKAQAVTMEMGGRPYGVGMLVAGVDDSGTHLYEFSPAATCFKYQAMAMGARSQSARTYLERYAEAFPSCTLQELVMHGLRALRDTVPVEKEAKDEMAWLENVTVGVVGLGVPFYVMEGEDELKPFMQSRMETE